MHQLHCYLLALEIEPMLPESYERLPVHCTLVHRFLTDLEPGALATLVAPLLNETPPIELLFGAEEIFGPPPVMVNVIAASAQHYKLHTSLVTTLAAAGVEYTEPQWVGLGYRPHVSHHNGAHLRTSSTVLCPAAYLIEVRVPGYDKLKFIRSKFNLNG